jgi:hypothetical protein
MLVDSRPSENPSEAKFGLELSRRAAVNTGEGLVARSTHRRDGSTGSLVVGHIKLNKLLHLTRAASKVHLRED